MRNYLDSGATEKKPWDYSELQTHHNNFARKGKRAFHKQQHLMKSIKYFPWGKTAYTVSNLDTLLREMYHKLPELKLQKER